MAYKLKSYTLTVKNAESEDKPNEDYFIADDSKGIYIVADGITSTPKRGEKYPNPSGGQLSAQIFCEEVYKHLLSQSKITVESAKRALRLANQEIFALNQKYNRYAEANFVDIDYFATVGSVVLVIGDKVLILHVGDTMVLLKRNSSLKLLTEVQTQSVNEYKRKMRDSGAACSIELSIEIRKNFRNNISATGINGERVGYGAFTGEDGVIDFIRTDPVPIHSGDMLLVLSDGLASLICNVIKAQDQIAAFCQILDQNLDSLDWIIQKNGDFEKRSDDKTVIIVNIM